MKERKSLPLLPVAILLAIVMLIGAYVIAYFRLGARNAVHGPANEVVRVVRLFPHKWQVTPFQPLAYAESWCLGVKVEMGDYGTYGDGTHGDPDEEETLSTPAFQAKHGDGADEEP